MEGWEVGAGKIWITKKFHLQIKFSLQCSRTCGKGEKFRLVQCVDVMSKSLTVVGDQLCTGSKKPLPNKLCNKQPCPFIWEVGDWSPVSIQFHFINTTSTHANKELCIFGTN